jgi:hypothetical protein
MSFSRVRAALGLFFVCALAAGPTACGSSRAERLRAADAAAGTGVFTWLATHTPDALVAPAAAVATLRDLVPGMRVAAAGAAPCAQARRDRAAWLALGDLRRGPARDRVLDCGVALYDDGRALVVVPR